MVLTESRLIVDYLMKCMVFLSADHLEVFS